MTRDFFPNSENESGRTQKETAQTGSRTAAGGVENQESLESGAVVGDLPDPVEDKVDDLLPGRVVSAGVVVGCVLLAVDDLLGMVQRLVRTAPDLVAHGRLQVDVNGAGHVLPTRRLAEEGAERVVVLDLVLHRPVGLDAVLEAVQLPALVTGLDARLAQMDTDAL